MATDDVMETLTDERTSPHLFLAGTLVLLVIVAVILFLVFPGP